MNPKEYWKKRDKFRKEEQEAVEKMLKTEKGAEQYIKELAKLKERAKEEIKKEIQDVYEAYKKRYELDDITAQQYLDEYVNYQEKEEYLNSIRERLKITTAEIEKEKLIAKYNAAASSYRINRWMFIKESIDKEVFNLANTELNITKKYIENVIKETAEKSGFEKINKKTLDEIYSSKFYGDHFSDRIWKRKDKLTEFLNNDFKEDLLLGRSYATTARKLSELLDVNLYNATRLIRTEGTFFHNQVQIELYKKRGIKEYKILATLDKRTSKICRHQDGKVYKTDEAKPGKNLPPFHPHCRSTIIPADTKVEGRRARDMVTNRNYKTKAKTYPEYYKEQQEKHEDVDLEIENKKDLNKKRDKEQYRRYKKVLEGNEYLPKTFEKFQEVKYNNIKEWRNLKLRKSIRENYNLNIHKGRQNKHIEGTNNYNQEIKQGRIKSKLTIDMEKSQELVNKYAGNTKIRRKNGKWIGREFIKVDYKIGEVLTEAGKWIDTDYFSIEYSKKKGTHIVPRLKKGGKR